MVYKLLSVLKNKNLKATNIGDYIQALAASQFLPHVDGFIDREEDLNNYSDDYCTVIMNGWFMHNPKNWPPTDNINPLFVSFHINYLAKNGLTSIDSVNYLKKHSPIGCRDYYTAEMLQEKGVDAYFSGCLTLTLGMKYATEKKSEKTYIVDPLIDIPDNKFYVLKQIFKSFGSFNDIWKLYRNPRLSFNSGVHFFREYVKTTLYYFEYSRIFGRDIIVNSEYEHQQSKYYYRTLPTNKQRIDEAERLVKEYAQAKFVITSRIHCALPCLGLGTPVVYIDTAKTTKADSCRMKGIINLFNVINQDHGRLIPQFETSIPISYDNIPVNKKEWIPLAENLIEKCKDFISKTQV